MELVDDTARLTVACILPSHTPVLISDEESTAGPCDTTILSGFGANVMISNFNILVEKTENPNRTSPKEPSEMHCYIHAKEIFVSSVNKKKGAMSSVTPEVSAGPCSSAIPLPVLGSHSTAETGTPVETSPSSLFVKIINKNQVLTPTSADISLSFSFTAQALIFTKDSASQSGMSIALNFPSDVFHLYSYINNGCVYELASATQCSAELPSLCGLVKEPCINVTKGMRFEFINAPASGDSSTNVLDVTDVVSMMFLPPFSTVINSSDSKESTSRWEHVHTVEIRHNDSFLQFCLFVILHCVCWSCMSSHTVRNVISLLTPLQVYE